MSRQFTRLGVFLSIIATCACLTASAQAKTIKFTGHCTGNLISATEIKGSCVTSLGHASFLDKRNGAAYTEVLTFSHGSLTVSGTVHLTKSGQVAGGFKITRGTGAYKHAKGSGSGTAVIGPPAKSTLDGKLTY